MELGKREGPGWSRPHSDLQRAWTPFGPFALGEIMRVVCLDFRLTRSSGSQFISETKHGK